MITERDIDQAITECLAERDPDAWTCIRMAAFLTIKQQLFDKTKQLPEDYKGMRMLRGASFASAPQTPAPQIISYSSGTEFASKIDGKTADNVWPIMDELMTVLQTLEPQIYANVLREIAKQR